MDDVERKLSELQREQFHSKELELKAAQDSHLAIEDLEKAVWWFMMITITIIFITCKYYLYFAIIFYNNTNVVNLST